MDSLILESEKTRNNTIITIAVTPKKRKATRVLLALLLFASKAEEFIAWPTKELPLLPESREESFSANSVPLPLDDCVNIEASLCV